MQGSQLKSYSYGIAAEHKPLDSRFLNVTPVETLPAIDGELNFSPTQIDVKGKDSQDRPYEVSTTTDVTLSAEWLPMGANRVTPPDIRRGEAVEIYRLGETDRYFWRVLGTHDHLRRLETVIFAFNGSPSETGNGININNCYFIEVSTHTGQITLGTSKANGEPFSYYMQFNTKDGEVNLQDDVGNEFELISAQSSIKLQNSSGSRLHLSKKVIDINAPQLVQIVSGGSSIRVTPGAIDVKSSAISITGGNVAFKKG